MRRWLLTLLGVVMMAASIYGYGRYAAAVETEAATFETVMPTRLIASGETVDASMLRRVPIPVGAAAADALTDERDIVGRTAVAPIAPNEQIAAWKLADRQLTPREGERFVTFPTDDVTNVGNMLRRGDRVDVWVEFEQPAAIDGALAGAVKAIEGLVVASVRSAEGAEVADAASFAYDAAFASAARQQQRARSAASAKAAMNTYIMDEPLYEAYALARLSGKIKLALPDLSLPDDAPARVSDAFIRYAASVAAGDAESESDAATGASLTTPADAANELTEGGEVQ
ncbi:RcpC/CpaB family pilus assembly protein [Paenibacillus sp. TRM 82003]|nr:RcpC/CpaB family pilus assembly protein [Paenibacillus sp. TRM 82003]